MSLDKKEPVQGLDALLAEEGLTGDDALRNLLTPLADLSASSAPAPGKELAALMAQKHTPSSWQRWLHKHRPVVVGIAVLAGMGLGATGVAASNPDTATSIYRSIVGEPAADWAWWWHRPEAVAGGSVPGTGKTEMLKVEPGAPESRDSEVPAPVTAETGGPLPAPDKTGNSGGQQSSAANGAGRSGAVDRPKTGSNALGNGTTSQWKKARVRPAASGAGVPHGFPSRFRPAGSDLVPSPAAAAGRGMDPDAGLPHLTGRIQFQLLGRGPMLVTTMPQLPYELSDLALVFRPAAGASVTPGDSLKDQLATATPEAGALTDSAEAAGLAAVRPGPSGLLNTGLGADLQEGSGSDAVGSDTAEPDTALDGASIDGGHTSQHGQRDVAGDQTDAPGKSFRPPVPVEVKTPPLPNPGRENFREPGWAAPGLSDAGGAVHNVPGPPSVSGGADADPGTSAPGYHDGGYPGIGQAGGETGNGGQNAPADQGRAARPVEPVVEAVQRRPVWQFINGNRSGAVRDASDFLKGAVGPKR